MIGIIGAMAVEVEKILEQMEPGTTTEISRISYHEGKLAGISCVVAQCGVGKVAAAVCAQTMILRFSPSAVINVGVAGGIGKEIHIGDVVVSHGLVQHDMDTSALGDEKGLISGLNLVTIPASPKLMEQVASVAESVYGKEKVHIGVIATGDQFIGDAARLNQIAAEFGACACEMEGGSIAQVCFLNRTDFIVIRAISDNANEEAATDFTQFARESAYSAAKMIAELVPKL